MFRKTREGVFLNSFFNQIGWNRKANFSIKIESKLVRVVNSGPEWTPECMKCCKFAGVYKRFCKFEGFRDPLKCGNCKITRFYKHLCDFCCPIWSFPWYFLPESSETDFCRKACAKKFFMNQSRACRNKNFSIENSFFIQNQPSASDGILGNDDWHSE